MTWSVASDGWACPLKRRENKVSARARSREGYVALLAVSFAFALVTLGTALAISLRGYLAAAGRTEQRIIDRISMESGAAAYLGQTASGRSQSIGPETLPPFFLNGRRVMIEVSLPEGKLDLSADDPKKLGDALKVENLPPEIAEAVRETEQHGLADVSRLASLSAVEEDCLRRGFTLGRAPDAFEPLAARVVSTSALRQPGPGDQVDLRLGLNPQSRTQTLWLRVRFSGGIRGWSFHDYRMLSLGAPERLCQPSARR